MTNSTPRDTAPMDPNTTEASPQQLDLARAQGDAYGRALEHMIGHVADAGGEKTAGHYRIGFAVEQAEGMYEWEDGELVWREPEDENLHLEISVRDAADGTFVPGVRVTATLLDERGNEVSAHRQPLVWHPMLYHYGRNWSIPADGEYTLRVRVEPPEFMRHDEVNGRRFDHAAEVEFPGVPIKRDPVGQIRRRLERVVAKAERAGIPHLILDPGIGYAHRNLVDQEAREPRARKRRAPGRRGATNRMRARARTPGETSCRPALGQLGRD